MTDKYVLRYVVSPFSSQSAQYSVVTSNPWLQIISLITPFSLYMAFYSQDIDINKEIISCEAGG